MLFSNAFVGNHFINNFHRGFAGKFFDWFQYDVSSGVRTKLWSNRSVFEAPDGTAVERGRLLELRFAEGGRSAGLVALDGGRQVWIFDDTGAVTETRGGLGALSNLAWRPDGSVACADADSGSG